LLNHKLGVFQIFVCKFLIKTAFRLQLLPARRAIIVWQS
jgi:hypothetical protein